jgi:hypothetical protein
MRRDKSRMGQKILPLLADLDEILAIGAVAVQKDHKLAWLAAARFQAGAVDHRCHIVSSIRSIWQGALPAGDGCSQGPFGKIGRAADFLLMQRYEMGLQGLR